MNGSVPFRGIESIHRAADGFRSSEPLRGLTALPIDVVYIAEIVLRLDVIPVTGLFTSLRMDAALLLDLTGLYVDEESYLSWEAGDRWTERRLRFSFAHELGHYVLHQKEMREHSFRTLAEFRKWAGDRCNYESAEYQANEFAGRFLVPREVLLEIYDEYREKAEAVDSSWMEIEGTREYLAKKIARRFGVNSQVIETRFDRERIWPAE